jgi:hypothetical protein
MIGASMQIFQNFTGNEWIYFFLNEKVVNSADSPWTNRGGQHEACRSRGMPALQGTAPSCGHSKIERATARCSRGVPQCGGAPETGW